MLDLQPKTGVYLIQVTRSRTLKLQDEDKKLAMLVMTHMLQRIPTFWQYFNTRIEALYGKEFHPDKSDRKDYDYLAIHYHWYNRYAEDVSFI